MARRPRADKPEPVPYHEQVATKLIEQLQAGTAPWQKPWAPGSLTLPHNPVSGTRYRGSNSMWLQMQGRGDPRWMTYKQAASIDAQVRKGEHGTIVQYWKFRDQIPLKDDAGKPVKDAEGKQRYKWVELDRPQVFTARVFNAEQIDGLPPLNQAAPAWDRHERAETILNNSGATIRHDQHDRAYYTPVRDSIHLPPRDAFPKPDGYDSTALHELGHWTGHPSRLARDLAHSFGSEGYAKEELRAEIASLMIGDQVGVGHDPGQHAAYVGSWIKALKEDPKEIIRAARDADKIADYVLAFEKEKAPEKPTAPAPGVPTIERPDPAPAGPQGPLDPAALAGRLSKAQAADLGYLAEVHKETAGSADYPDGRPEKLRTGARLEGLGLVVNARSEANDFDHWRITPLGVTAAGHLPPRDKSADPATPAPGPGPAAVLEPPPPTKPDGQAKPETPAARLKAALEGRDLKAAMDVLQPLTLPRATEAALYAGLSVPAVKSKPEFYRAMQPQLLKAMQPATAEPAAPARARVQEQRER